MEKVIKIPTRRNEFTRHKIQKIVKIHTLQPLSSKGSSGLGESTTLTFG